MNNFKKLIAIPALALLLCGCGGNAPVSSVEESTEPSTTYPFPEFDPESYGGYYKDIGYDDEDTTFMRFNLHQLMVNTHTTYYQYGNMSKYASQTDMDPDKPSQLMYFYTSKKTTSYGSREHVWPCANSNGLWGRDDGKDIGESYVGGGSDLYHVRPCTNSVNTARQNYRFYEFLEGEEYKTISDGGAYQLRYSVDAKKAEPADEWKGDIARIVVYLFVHYGSYASSDEKDKYTGTLDLSDVIFRASGESMQTLYERICRWNRLDPVSEQEKLRNENVFKLQGNRNPFVDYPQLMEKMFNVNLG